MHHGYSSAVCSHAGGLVLQDSEPHDCTGEKTDRARGQRSSDDGLYTLGSFGLDSPVRTVLGSVGVCGVWTVLESCTTVRGSRAASRVRCVETPE